MNFKTTFLLIILLLFVGGFFLLTREAETTREREDRLKELAKQGAGTPLFSADMLSTQAVNHLVVERSGTGYEFAKIDGKWWQQKPVRFEVETSQMENIIDTVASLRFLQQFLPGENQMPELKDLDLIDPSGSVTLRFDDGKSPITLRLGKRTTGSMAYVMFPNKSEVYLTPDTLHARVLEDNILYWRNRKLHAGSEPKSERVVLEYNGDKVELVKAAGNWSFAMPHTGRADSHSITTLINSLNDCFAGDFLQDLTSTEQLALYGLDKPRLTLTVVPMASSTATQPDQEAPQTTPSRTLRVGAFTDLKKDRCFATWSEGSEISLVVFELAESYVDKLEKTADDLRDPRMTTVRFNDLRQMTVERSGKDTLNVMRSPEGWTFGDPDIPYELDPSSTSTLIDKVLDAKAAGYQPNPAPDQLPLATITINVIGRPEPEIIRVYGSNDESRYLTVRNNESVGYLIPINSLEPAFQPLRGLRNRTVALLDRDHISAVTVKRSDGPTYSFTRTPADLTADMAGPTADPGDSQPGPWKLDGAEQFEIDALNDLLNHIAPLKAQKWLDASTDLGDQTIELTIVADDQTYQLQAAPDKLAARAQGIDGVFEISENLAKAVEAEFRDRTILPLRTREIKELTINRDGVSILIQKDENGNYFAAGGQTINQDTVAVLADTLAGLRAVRLVDQGKPGKERIQIELVTKDDRKYDLRLYEEKLASLDGRLFTLDTSTIIKLEAELLPDFQAAK